MSEENNGLPPERKAAVMAGLEQFQSVAADRQRWEAKCRDLETTIAGYKVAMEAQEARVAELESRAQTMQLQRDEAISDRAVYETLFISIKAQLRAFAIPNEPLIRERNDNEDILEAMREAPHHTTAITREHYERLGRDLINVGRSQRGEPVPERGRGS
jgi:hypothetical protein